MRSVRQPIRLIANFASTPFELDGTTYACVEAFWQSLRFPVAERPRIAALDGPRAKQESEQMLVHQVRRDSRTIPGVIMADIWMRIRPNLSRSN